MSVKFKSGGDAWSAQGLDRAFLFSASLDFAVTVWRPYETKGGIP